MITHVNSLRTLGFGKTKLKKEKISIEKELELRKKITEKVKELKSLGASDEVIKDFLDRTERIFSIKK